jgi:hypothetical protein
MKKGGVIGIVLLVLMGCKSLSPVATTGVIDTRLRPRAVQQQIEENALRFERLQWRGQASLEREGKRQKVSVTLRLKQGRRNLGKRVCDCTLGTCSHNAQAASVL